MANELLLVCKVGDQIGSPGKPGYKDGDPICYFLKSDYSLQDWQKILSDNDSQRVFAWFKVDMARLDLVKQFCTQGVSGIRDARVNFDKLEEIAGINNIVETLRDPIKRAGIIDCTTIPHEEIIQTDPLPPADDINAISSGSYNVGAGETYTSWALFAADFASLTGDLTGTQTSDITEPSAVFFSENLNGHTLSFLNPDFYLTTFNSAFRGFWASPEGPGTVTIDGVHVKLGINALVSTYGILCECDGVSTGFDLEIKNSHCDLNGFTGTGVHVNAGAVNLELSSCYIWNDTGLSGQAVYPQTVSGSSKIDGVTARGSQFCFRVNNQTIAINNCFAFEASSLRFLTLGNATGTNNCDDTTSVSNSNWGTGSGNIPSVTPADEFRSLDDTDLTIYLKAVSTGACAKAGGPSIISGRTGIRGNVVPNAEGFYSIGADQLGSIVLTSPVGGESWQELDNEDITWLGTNIDGTINIKYSSDSGVTFTKDILVSGVDNGVYDWTIAEAPTSKARIKIISESDTGVFNSSDADFDIISADIPKPPEETKTFTGTAEINKTFTGVTELNLTFTGTAEKTILFKAGN